MQLHQDIENELFSYDYKNLVFKDYTAFMEAMSVHGVVDDQFTRIRQDGKYIWNLLPVTISTTNHPLLENGNAGTVTVVGSKQDIETVHMLVSRYSVCEKYISPSQVKIPAEYHKNLNPILWKDDHLKLSIKDQIDDIVDSYTEFLDLPGLKVDDVVITGSCANYNWNSKSDIDIHIVIDITKAESKFGKVVSKYFDSMRQQWNSLHKITICDIPVEIYIQDINEKHNSTGIYSVSNKKWIIEPEYDKPTINRSDVKKKAAVYITKINKVCKGNQISAIEQLFDDIKEMRQSDLEKDGEFSVGNLVFKTLRNNGYIEQLVNHKYKLIDKKLSLQEALKTDCMTRGAVYKINVSPTKVSATVELNKHIELDKNQAKQLEKNIHNSIEMVLAPYFKDSV